LKKEDCDVETKDLNKNKKTVINNLTKQKSGIFKRIFSLFPDTEIEKANLILNQIINTMADEKTKKENSEVEITDEMIQKAYEELENDSEDTIEKSEDTEELEKGKKEDEDEDEDEDMEDDEDIDDDEDDDDDDDDKEKEEVKKSKKIKKGKDEKKEDDKIEDEDKDEKIEKVKKGKDEKVKSPLTMIKKGEESQELNPQGKNIATILKGIEQKLEKGIDAINERINELEDLPEQRKSIIKAKAIERFEKGKDEENQNVLSISKNRSQVLNIMDQLAFEKGINIDIANAMTKYESTGQISKAIADMIEKEKNIKLVI